MTLVSNYTDLMSSQFATISALLLYMAALLPVLVILVRPRFATESAIVFAAAVIGLGFAQTGIFQRASLSPIEGPAFSPSGAVGARCQQALDLLVEAGVVLQPPDERGLTVEGEMWDQLPPQAQEAVLTCARETFSETSEMDELELIRR